MDALAEVARVRDHFVRADHFVTSRASPGLSHLQRLIRQLLLRELARYRRAGRFPLNRDFEERTPYFVDASGTRCAVAHLLELGGEADLVARIARERNNAYVRELADEPRLRAWLAAAGLTLGEAAVIQPAYCGITGDCVCGGAQNQVFYPVPAEGVLEGFSDGAGLMRIAATHGDARGHEIGDVIPFSLSYPEVDARNARILVPVGSSADYGVRVGPDEFHDCTRGAKVSREAFITAVLSDDCRDALAELEAHHFVGGDIRCDEGCGCAAGADDPTSLAILLALVAAVAPRRSRRMHQERHP